MTVLLRRILLTVLFMLLTAVTIFTLLIMLAPKPPEAEIELARQKIAEARTCKANIYSPDLFSASEKYYNSAMKAWRKENDRFYSSRNYQQVKTLARKAAEAAEKAKKDASSLSVSMKADLKDRIENLQKTVGNIQDVISILPLPENVIKGNSKGILLLNEARSAYQKKQYKTCLVKIDQAQAFIDRSAEYAMKLLTGYFKNQPEWKKLAESAISRSKKEKCTSIIVDKFARTCLVYQNGKLKHSFDVELGENWIGDKRHMGDKTTPEGTYQVIQRMENGRTKFYKALLLNYPNDDDVRKFNNEKENGTLSRSARIGNRIEIHGEGGKGIDWTNGCIALNNKDMDMLYNVTQIGTSVTIVGSLKPLGEIVSLSNR